MVLPSSLLLVSQRSSSRAVLLSQLLTVGKNRFFHATSTTEAKLTVQQLAEKVNLKGQNVLVRVDLNVPLAKVRSIRFVGRHRDSTVRVWYGL